MERISGRQVVLIGAVLASAAPLVTMQSQIYAVAQHDAWLFFIPAALLGMLMLWLTASVTRRFPEQDLYSALISRSPILGRLIAVGYILFFLFILARDLRMLTDFVGITLLPNTPVLILAVLVGLCAIGGARGGLEILARMTESFGPTYFLVGALLPLVLLKDFSLQYFQPIIAEGILRPIKGAWVPIAYLGEIVALPLICPPKLFTLRRGLYGFLLGTGLVALLTALGQGVIGHLILERSLYPAYELVRQVRVTDFLDRLDLFFVGIYMPVLLTKIAYNLHVVCHGMQRVASGVSAHLIATPMGLLGVVCSLWFFPTTVQVVHLNRSWPVLALFFQLVIPLLLFAFLRPKRRDKMAPDSATTA